MANAIVARQLGAERLLILHSDDDARSLTPARRLQQWFSGQAALRAVGDGMRYGEVRQVTARLLTRLADQAVEPAREIVVNVTGGTKPMSLAAAAAAHRVGCAAVYLDSRGGRLHYLAGEGETLPITCSFGIDEILALHGYLIRAERWFNAELVRLAGWCAATREFDSIRVPALGSNWTTTRSSLTTARAMRLHQAGLLASPLPVQERYRLTRAGLDLCQRQWLEVLVAEAFRAAGAVAVRLGVKLAAPRDELDVVAVSGTRLVVVECKSQQDHPGADAFKTIAADARNLGGQLAVPVLVWAPAQPPSAELAAWFRRTAPDYGVRGCIGSDLDELTACFRNLLHAPGDDPP